MKELMDDFEDLVQAQEAKKFRKATGESCISRPELLQRSELSHMESPEIDAMHESKIDRQAASLFAKLPTPEDPMKAALRPTRDEIEAHEKFEAFKEAVREKYRNRKMRQANEQGRIDKAMKQVEEGTYEVKRESLDEECGGYKPYRPVKGNPADEAEIASLKKEKSGLEAEIEKAKQQLRELEEKLKRSQAQGGSTPPSATT
jgi:hypothetical protein